LLDPEWEWAEEGGVEALKWRSERVRGRAVLNALGGLPGGADSPSS
jgi:hypothetical protein